MAVLSPDNSRIIHARAISAALSVVLFFLVMQRRFVASFTAAAIKR